MTLARLLAAACAAWFVAAAALADGRLTVALDPGHGGIDPGAQADGLNEADLVLAFARRLEEELLRIGRFDVMLTRTADVFVPLERRMTLARQAEADVFLSLHADALPEDAGEATGLTVYTLSDDVTDAAALRLAERHAGDDILAGLDLTGTEDEIAMILLDLARRETAPRSLALADTLVETVGNAGLTLNSKPRRDGAFAVLKAADVPSVLIELGFLSSAADRARLRSDAWSERAARAIAQAIALWADAEAVSR
ncbi:MAG: N-acetylmuramoyl-L-alanine amidase [Pseudomonadota bacterium]